MDNSITPQTDIHGHNADDAVALGRAIVESFCGGSSTKDVAKELGMTVSQVNTAFNDIRVKACLPQERKAYPACADAVVDNLDRYVQHLANMGKLAESYVASQTKFKF